MIETLKAAYDRHVLGIVASSQSQDTGLSSGFFASADIPSEWNVSKLLKSDQIELGELDDIHSFDLTQKGDDYELKSHYDHTEYSVEVLFAHNITEEQGRAFIGQFDTYCAKQAKQQIDSQIGMKVSL